MARKELLLLQIILVAFLAPGVQPQPLTPEERTRVDEFMREVRECSSHTGMIVSMVRGGETVFTGAYGLAVDNEGTENDIPATTSTVFPIASCSKHFTGTIIGHVLQNTNYDWDTPVHQILRDQGEDVYFIDMLRTNEMSLRDLLAHRHGIPGHDVILAANTFSREELMQRIRFLKPTSPIRNNYDYNNILYGLAAYVVEKISGKTWDQLLKEEFWDKLGMTRTSTLLLGNSTGYDGWARGHVSLLGESILGPLDMARFGGVARGAAGAGGVAITAEDWGRWMNFQMHNIQEEITHPQIIDDVRSTSQITRRLVRRGSTKPDRPWFRGNVGYGLGWGMGWYRGNPTVSHGGSLLFYTSSMGMLPYRNIGVGMAVNNPGSPSRASQFAMDILLGVEPTVNISTVCGLIQKDKEEQEADLENEDGMDEDFPGMKLMLQGIIRNLPKDELNQLKKAVKQKKTHNLFMDKHMNKLFKALADMDENPRRKVKKLRKRRQAGRPLDAYTGTFGNFAYGNVTISIYPDDPDDDFTGDLMLTYGQIELTLDRDEENPDKFDISILGLVEIFGDQVTFWGSGPDGNIDRAEIPLDPRDGPYSYARDRMFSDAPPPNTGNCPNPPVCLET
ncbi:unnamed protein product [Owenia fusiformis]|uniref:Beta-lactamase-related domain-containing protein n=1 Tax=Owenia fusiformis TaxID=6347 RepID=A0A8S4Q9E0_OWEFU|nr:unnamed protein product [Owenia fusiformis]